MSNVRGGTAYIDQTGDAGCISHERIHIEDHPIPNAKADTTSIDLIATEVCFFYERVHIEDGPLPRIKGALHMLTSLLMKATLFMKECIEKMVPCLV